MTSARFLAYLWGSLNTPFWEKKFHISRATQLSSLVSRMLSLTPTSDIGSNTWDGSANVCHTPQRSATGCFVIRPWSEAVHVDSDGSGSAAARTPSRSCARSCGWSLRHGPLAPTTHSRSPRRSWGAMGRKATRGDPGHEVRHDWRPLAWPWLWLETWVEFGSSDFPHRPSAARWSGGTSCGRSSGCGGKSLRTMSGNDLLSPSPWRACSCGLFQTRSDTLGVLPSSFPSLARRPPSWLDCPVEDGEGDLPADRTVRRSTWLSKPTGSCWAIWNWVFWSLSRDCSALENDLAVSSAKLTVRGFASALLLFSWFGLAFSTVWKAVALMSSDMVTWVWQNPFVPLIGAVKRSIMSSRYSLRSLSTIGIDRPSFLKKIWLLSVSMTAPKDLKTLLAMRNGVLEGTTITFIQNGPMGKNTAFFPVTMLLLPNLKLTLQGASLSSPRISAGREWHSSENWRWPMTDMLAPKSTIPVDPCETKNELSGKSSSVLGPRGSGRGDVLPRCGWIILFGLTMARSRVTRSGRIFMIWDCTWSWFRLLRILAGGKQIPGLFKRGELLFRTSSTVKATAFSGSSDTKSPSGSIGSPSVARDTPAKAVGAPVAGAAALDPTLNLWGHSAFQCPFWWHILHELSKILWAKGFLNWDLKPPLNFPLPFPLLVFEGPQNPRPLALSRRRFLAST